MLRAVGDGALVIVSTLRPAGAYVAVQDCGSLEKRLQRETSLAANLWSRWPREAPSSEEGRPRGHSFRRLKRGTTFAHTASENDFRTTRNIRRITSRASRRPSCPESNTAIPSRASRLKRSRRPERRSGVETIAVPEKTSPVLEPSPGATVQLSAQTVLLRGERAVPNRALALLERDGDSWRFVRAHMWFETRRPVKGTVAIVRSRP